MTTTTLQSGEALPVGGPEASLERRVIAVYALRINAERQAGNAYQQARHPGCALVVEPTEDGGFAVVVTPANATTIIEARVGRLERQRVRASQKIASKDKVTAGAGRVELAQVNYALNELRAVRDDIWAAGLS